MLETSVLMAITKTKQQYIASKWSDWMSDRGLQDFDVLWTLELETVDEGNYDRGGWSTVCRFDHDDRAFYIKRQSNHLCYSLQAFPFKVPTLKVEFDKISWYHQHEIPCLDVVYFGK